MATPDIFTTSTSPTNLSSSQMQATQSPPWQNFTSVHYIFLAFILACAIPCFTHAPLIRRGVLFLQFTCLLQSFLVAPPTNEKNTSVLYIAGVLMGNITMRCLDRLYLHVPEEDFHRVDKQGNKEDVRKLSLFQRFLWGFELLAVTRGVGWDWRIAVIPKQRPQSRAQFLTIRMFKYVAMWTGLYLTSVISQMILNEFSFMSNSRLRDTLISFTSNTVFLYVFITLGWAMTIYSHFGLLNLPLGFVCVGLRVGPRSWQEIESWPPNFGSLTDAYSIRRFWGITWHQQLRRITSAPGIFVFSKLPISMQKSKSLPARLFRRYSLVLASFLMSGCIHACGTYNVTRVLQLPLSTGGDIQFYLAQGIALISEDFVCWVVGVDDQLNRPSKARMTIGYIITAAFHIWSRVTLKGIPIGIAHGYRDDRGALFVALKAMEVGAAAVPGNFVRLGIESFTKVKST